MTRHAPPAAADDDFTRLVNGYAELPAEPASPAAPAVEVAATEAPPTAADADGSDPTTPEERLAAKRALYEAFLKAEGYRYEVDEDGDISLRREGRWLALFASDDDPDYFRLALPNVWECESERESRVALETANQMNPTFKVIKFVVRDGWVWANVEQYFHPLEAFVGSFERSADLICETAAEFRRRMRKAMAEEPRPALKPEPEGDFAFADDATEEPA